MQDVKRQELSDIKIKIKEYLKYFIIIVFIFFFDRISKIYLLNLYDSGTDVDFYILPYLNIYLVFNTGVGFGLFASESNFIYHFLTFVVGIINLVLILLLFKQNSMNKYFISIILGGSLGNFFDRIYYSFVPDFLDFHIENFHWFIFNIADVFITIGIICLIIVEIFTKDTNVNNEKNI